MKYDFQIAWNREKLEKPAPLTVAGRKTIDVQVHNIYNVYWIEGKISRRKFGGGGFPAKVVRQ